MSPGGPSGATAATPATPVNDRSGWVSLLDEGQASSTVAGRTGPGGPGSPTMSPGSRGIKMPPVPMGSTGRTGFPGSSPGLVRTPGTMPPTGLPSPEVAKPGSGQHLRTEFIVLFFWEEKAPSDQYLNKPTTSAIPPVQPTLGPSLPPPKPPASDDDTVLKRGG